MKVTHYTVTGPWPGVVKQHSIMARSGDKSNGYFPIAYLQRPKWIKDDAAWETICNSIQLKLPKNFEVT